MFVSCHAWGRATLTLLVAAVVCFLISFPTLSDGNQTQIDEQTENCTSSGCLGNFYLYIDGVTYEDTDRVGFFSCLFFDFNIRAFDINHYQQYNNYLLYENVMFLAEDISMSQKIRPELIPPENLGSATQFSGILSGVVDGIEYKSRVIVVNRSQVCLAPKCFVGARIQYLQDIYEIEILPLGENDEYKNLQCKQRLQQ